MFWKWDVSCFLFIYDLLVLAYIISNDDSDSTSLSQIAPRQVKLDKAFKLTSVFLTQIV